MAKIVYLCIAFIIAIVLDPSTANKCDQKSPCMCKLDDYSQINLTQLIEASDTKFKFLFSSNINHTYFFSGCNDAYFNAQDYGLNSNQTYNNASLVKCIAVAPHDNVTYITYNCLNIGQSNQITYDLISNSKSDYQIIYNVKEGVSASIQLDCIKYNSTALSILNDQSDVLALYSPAVCIKYQSHHELSTGSIFCILFFVAAVIYFVGGGIIMYTARGARGVEVIPNFDFWVSLPGLMRDGMVFILSGCRPFTVATTAETYDRI